MSLFEHWRQLFEIAGLCLTDDRYCQLLNTPWAYSIEVSILIVCALVAWFAWLAGQVSKLMKEERK